MLGRLANLAQLVEADQRSLSISRQGVQYLHPGIPILLLVLALSRSDSRACGILGNI